MKLSSMFGVLALVSGLLTSSIGEGPQQNWTHKVRIAAFSLNRGDADQIVRKAAEDHVYGIEVDNDIPGRYESFLEPTEKLKVLRTVSQQVHKANNKVYSLHMYEGKQHGFHNDTTPRYDEAAAKLAWQRTLDWFNKYLR